MGQTILNLMGFSCFIDPKFIQTKNLDQNWKERCLPWLIKMKFRLQELFKNYSNFPTAKSTRREFLYYLNKILDRNFGVSIKMIGKGTRQRQQYALHFKVPLIIQGSSWPHKATRDHCLHSKNEWLELIPI